MYIGFMLIKGFQVGSSAGVSDVREKSGAPVVVQRVLDFFRDHGSVKAGCTMDLNVSPQAQEVSFFFPVVALFKIANYVNKSIDRFNGLRREVVTELSLRVSQIPNQPRKRSILSILRDSNSTRTARRSTLNFPFHDSTEDPHGWLYARNNISKFKLYPGLVNKGNFAFHLKELLYKGHDG
ncbi:hypothetical protein FNV43_RR16929 [Rhamnella rubrinervis]|uniref:Uncharacterized protein n=1 Tax=Rhamnella rubrinervis TaxID=2594499 RepID=A0A8K0GZP3_9ROSA|nr:hypothetical protein FNV43_RR16929 [Rhamnella rubrinervis]